MPAIGWKCQCGKTIEEGTNFKWEFKCSCNADEYTAHSGECLERDWKAKEETELKPLVDKHLEICSQALKCKKCHKIFKYKEPSTGVNNSERAGNYHKNCWEKIQSERNNDEQRERERETKSSQQIQERSLSTM